MKQTFVRGDCQWQPSTQSGPSVSPRPFGAIDHLAVREASGSGVVMSRLQNVRSGGYRPTKTLDGLGI